MTTSIKGQASAFLCRRITPSILVRVQACSGQRALVNEGRDTELIGGVMGSSEMGLRCHGVFTRPIASAYSEAPHTRPLSALSRTRTPGAVKRWPASASGKKANVVSNGSIVRTMF